MSKQVITSAGTSVATTPALLKMLQKHRWDDNGFYPSPCSYWDSLTDDCYGAQDCLDYGGGRYELTTDCLAEHKIRNWVYDPFNRSVQHNEYVQRMLSTRPADFAICSNVLNVIREPAARQGVLRHIRELTKTLGSVFFTVYEGGRSSKGRKTTKGWQANRPTKSYVREVKRVFGDTQVHGKLIVGRA